MDLIIKIFVWVSNCFSSGKAQALGYTLLGAFISFIVLKLLTNAIDLAIFFNPQTAHFISKHWNIFVIGFYLACLTPLVLGAYVSIKQFQYIYNKESYRHF